MLNRLIFKQNVSLFFGCFFSAVSSLCSSKRRFAFVFYNRVHKKKSIVRLPSVVFFKLFSKGVGFLFSNFYQNTCSRLFIKRLMLFLDDFFSGEFRMQAFRFKIVISGIGTRIESTKQKQLFKLVFGFSHNVFVKLPYNVQPTLLEPQVLMLLGFNKQQLGQICGRMLFFKKATLFNQKGLLFFNMSCERFVRSLLFKQGFKKEIVKS